MTDPIPLILSSIRLTKGIHPKFFYLGEGARNWVRFSKDRKYRLGNAEEKFLVRSLPEILRLAGTRPVNIVDLGPGTGYKGRVILQRLRTCRQPAAYVALDISEEILRVALKNIRESLRGSVRTRSCVIDFEDRSLKPIFRKIRQDFHKFSLVLLLGSGNVTNKPRVMQNIRGGMAASDYFLLSAELLDPADVERVLRPYRRKESHDVVSHGLKLLGIKYSDGHFDVRFNRSRSQVEVSFVLHRDFTVSVGGGAVFKKGMRIRLFTSYKPTVSLLRRFLRRMGFEIVKFLRDEEENLALVLCRKRGPANVSARNP